jgi:hypothetical protein
MAGIMKRVCYFLLREMGVGPFHPFTAPAGPCKTTPIGR